MDVQPDSAPPERRFDDIGRWWFAPLGTKEPWVATGYLLGSIVLAIVWLVVGVVVAAFSLVLAIVVVGLPAIATLLTGLVRLGAVERARARWVGAEIQPPDLVRGSLVNGWRARLADPARWRALAYFVSSFFVYGLLTALALGFWALPVYLITFPLWGWAVGASPIGLLVSLATGIALTGLSPRVALQLGRLGAGFTRTLLGRDEVAVMQEQVDRLAASRTEILAAVATERRRIERNLHDGVQQHLVAVGIDLSLAASKIEHDPDGAAELLRAAAEKNRASIGELRTIGRGLHPAVLDDRGLDAALSAVVASSAVPIELTIEPGLELPIDTAENAYFVVAETITNMVKHARARTGSVHITDTDGVLLIRVHDDGRGGADPANGTGLAGTVARVEGADGSVAISSPKGGPTRIEARLPHG